LLFIFQKNNTPKLLVPTNIKLNNPINYVKKLNELKEQMVSSCLAFAPTWQLKVTVIVVTYEIRVFFEGAQKEVFSSIFKKSL
jgi:hypothetical protein